MTETPSGTGLGGRKTPEEIFNMPNYPVKLDSLQQPSINAQQQLFNAQLASVVSPNMPVPIGSLVPFGDLNAVVPLPGAANSIPASESQRWIGRQNSKRTARDDQGFEDQAVTSGGRCTWDNDDVTIDLFEAVRNTITSSAVGCADWKKVSHLMAFKGYKYSPQQCKSRHANVQATYKAAAYVTGPHRSGLQPWESMSSEERKAHGFKIPNFSKNLFYRLEAFFARRTDVMPVHIMDASAPKHHSKQPVAFDEISNMETKDPTDQTKPSLQSSPIFESDQDDNGKPPEGDLQKLDDVDDGRVADGDTKASIVVLNNSPILQAGLHAGLGTKRKRTSIQDELVSVAKRGQALAATHMQQMITLLSESNARAQENYDEVTNLQHAFLNQAAAHHKASLKIQQKVAMIFVEGSEKFLNAILKVASLRMAPALPPATTSAAFEKQFKKG